MYQNAPGVNALKERRCPRLISCAALLLKAALSGAIPAEGALSIPSCASRFDVVGYGCMTCIGNSGPLPEPVVEAITQVIPGAYGSSELWPLLIRCVTKTLVNFKEGLGKQGL